MHEEGILHPIVVVVGLLFVAAISGVLAKRIRLPYTVGLVLAGVLLGLAAANFDLEHLRKVQLTPGIILFLRCP